MAHEYEKKIICPHCDIIFTDNEYEHDDDDGETFTCGSCGKDFELGVHIDVTYSTHKVDCKDNHNMDADNPIISIVDQRICDRWIRIVHCNNCEKVNFVDDKGNIEYKNI